MDYSRHPVFAKTYGSWRAMLQRCYDKKFVHYRYYGGKGITVCERWHNFPDFLFDMGIKPEGHRMALDRVDSNRNYELTNCQWISQSENGKKARAKTILISRAKLEKMCSNCIDLL